ncbi:MAG: hypothetical protein ACK40X_05540 [Armatimonadota bacterium]
MWATVIFNSRRRQSPNATNLPTYRIAEIPCLKEMGTKGLKKFVYALTFSSHHFAGTTS